MAEPKDKCVKPAGGPILETKDKPEEQIVSQKGGYKMIARVGKPAPDFEASAFYKGGFENIKLSKYKGKWVLLCFYPGDFTFV
jgi:peroxiredoxin (alkyl hydroperoxide reductase subunit C)